MRRFIKKILDIPSLKTNKKYLLILSDDWGSLRIRSKKDQEALVKKGLSIYNRFDKCDSLETNQDLELLFEVLTKYKDHRGNHPVITAVCNVANPDFARIREAKYEKYFFETIDQTYQRYPDSDRVLRLVEEGIQSKIFIPQSHGREHLQVNWWMQELQQADSYARKYFENEFFFVPASQLFHSYRNRDLSAAFDVWDKKDIESQKDIISSGLDTFEQLFGYRSHLFTPPAMYYTPSIEKDLFNSGVQWLDVGRLFKVPFPDGSEKWQLNYFGKKKKSGLRVLVRNAMFESNIAAEDNEVLKCLADIKQAFAVSQPAIISNHRASFVGRIDVNNRKKGLEALDLLLSKVLKKWPDVEFISGPELVKILE